MTHVSRQEMCTEGFFKIKDGLNLCITWINLQRFVNIVIVVMKDLFIYLFIYFIFSYGVPGLINVIHLQRERN